MRSSRIMLVVGMAAALAGLTPAARAQTTARHINALSFPLTPDSNGILTVESSSTLGHLKFHVGLMFAYINDPLEAERDGKTVFKYVHRQATMDVVAAIGFSHYISLGFHLPVVMYQDSQGNPAAVGDIADLKSAATGDLRIVPKFRFWKDRGHGFGLAFAPAFTVPTGFKHANTGEQTATFEPRIALDYHFRQGTRLALNVGVRIRDTFSVANLSVYHEFAYGLGAEVPFWRRQLAALAEIYGSVAFKDSPADSNRLVDLEEAPMQALLGLRYRTPCGFILTAGAGMALTSGYGAPDFRVFLGAGYAPPLKRTPARAKDSDGDGILDKDDKCPTEAEDMDGFQDDDGCPDPDNDQDGVCDGNPTIQAHLARYVEICKGADKAPNDAEDKDGFEDEDGVPDPDNDQDGVCDDNPTIQKNLSKYASVCKGADKAPNDAEDRDGFEDEDGVPDPDNDKDGVCDDNPTIQKNLSKYASVCKGADKAPDDAEDKDGFEDEDGVPDPDNDKDGVCDDNPTIQKNLAKYASICTGADKCPNEAGPDMGCPAKGPTHIDVRKRQIVIMEQVNFGYNNAVIMKTSFQLLKAVAKVLVDNPWISQIQVEGHTDDRGNATANQKLSQRRADSVMAFLVKEGVAKERMISKGFGHVSPLEEGCKTRKTNKERNTCWAANRRVVFSILKTEVGTAPEPTKAPDPGKTPDPEIKLNR